jgi:hypothetical protein
VCPAASASLAFARNFANASLREYLFSAGKGGIAIRLSNAAMAAWSIASVITSLCVIKFLRRVSCNEEYMHNSTRGDQNRNVKTPLFIG